MKDGRKEDNNKRPRDPCTASVVTEQGKNIAASDAYVVFDFTDLHKPTVSDLALVLTARLQTPPSESVWARAIHPRTASILRALRLDHMFPGYPDPGDLH